MLNENNVYNENKKNFQQKTDLVDLKSTNVLLPGAEQCQRSVNFDVISERLEWLIH